MNFRFEVVLDTDGEGDYATLYSFLVGDRPIHELSLFLTNAEHGQVPDLNPLADRLVRARDELGLYHGQSDFGPYRWFRDEGDGVSALWAPIPYEDRATMREPYPSLRLYCFRLEHMLIVGNGGVKKTKSVFQDPELERALKDIKYVRQRLKRRLEEGTVRIVEDGFLLEGDLLFEAEIT